MQVMQLQPFEGVRVDQDRLSALYASIGVAEAQESLCRAMEDISQRMTLCDVFYRSGDQDALRSNAHELITIAEKVGMDSLSRVAGDVIHCIDKLDEVALTATLSRLIRIAEKSLIAIWDMQDAES